MKIRKYILVLITLQLAIVGMIPLLTFPGAAVIQSIPVSIWLVHVVLSLAIMLFLANFRHRRFLFLSIFATGAVGVLFCLFQGNGGLEPAGRLKFATWNTRYWDQHEPKGLMIAGVAALGSDITTLQERIYWDDNLQKIVPAPSDDLGALGYQHFWSKGELVTLSRFSGQVVPIDDPNILLVRLETPEGILYVANVHVPVHLTLFFPIWTTHFWRYALNAAAERARTFEALNSSVIGFAPLLIAGDFNSTSLMPDLRSLQLKFYAPALFWQRGTFPAAGMSMEGLWRIDHVFGVGVVTNKCKVLPTGKSHGSDHDPIVCDVTRIL